MKGYIDIHSHILPGIDDGAENFGISMEMLKIAEENGIEVIILTPHHKPMRNSAGAGKVKALTAQLLEKSRESGMAIQLYAGNELYYSSETVHILEEKQACTMAGSDYVLVEFGPMDEQDYIRKGIYHVLSAGYRPILAHVERYGSVCARIEYVEDLVAMGCYIQVNAGSILGQFGWKEKQTVRKLLKKELIHFVATDAHSSYVRTPALLDCARYLEKRYGEEYAARLLHVNPMQVIANRYI